MSTGNILPSLYSITDEINTLDQMLETAIANEDDAAAASELQDQVSALIQAKTDNCVAYSRYLDDMDELAAKRIKELQDLRKTLANKQGRFKSYLVFCLDKLGVSKLTGVFSSISLRAPSKSVEVFDEALLPAQYVKTSVVVTPDKIEISRQLKAGEVIPGARLVEGNKSVLLK